MTIEYGQSLYLPELNDHIFSPLYAVSLGIPVEESVGGVDNLEVAGLKVID